MKKTIVVTGGAGFIGSNLCEKLIELEHQVISIDNYSFGLKENHIPEVEYLDGETKDITQLLANKKVDLIFHLGEYSRVEQSFTDVKEVLDSNTVGTQAVLEYVRHNGCKLVYAGSSTKFAEGGNGRDQSPYAWTKAVNTDLVRNYGTWYDIPYAITYFYNAYGPRERGDTATGTLIKIFHDRYAKGLPLQVRKPGNQRRNFTHVADIVDGLILVGEKGEGDDYGLGHPTSYSVEEVAKMFGTKIEELPERPGNRTGSPVDTKRTNLELVWTPKYDLPDYIKSIL